MRALPLARPLFFPPSGARDIGGVACAAGRRCLGVVSTWLQAKGAARGAHLGGRPAGAAGVRRPGCEHDGVYGTPSIGTFLKDSDGAFHADTEELGESLWVAADAEGHVPVDPAKRYGLCEGLVEAHRAELCQAIVVAQLVGVAGADVRPGGVVHDEYLCHHLALAGPVGCREQGLADD